MKTSSRLDPALKARRLLNTIARGVARGTFIHEQESP